MRLYLAPSSSIELIRYLRAANGQSGIAGSTVRKRALDDAINTTRGVDELDFSAELMLQHVTRPIHAYVASREKGTSTKRLVTHVLSDPVPNGVLLNLGHGVCMCTPQFAFMQMAKQLAFIDAVCLGMELCGTYSRWRDTRNGPHRTLDLEGVQGCTFGVPTATQTYRLKAFVARMEGHHGAVNARAALRWIADGSASPMETAVYLLLCLPKRLGGYGLPKPALNPKLTISNPDGVKKRYPDLFWLGPNIDVEYNSDASHSGEWSRYRDSKREVELTVANVKVLPLTRAQLMDPDGFDAFAQGLRRMLGIRARKPDGMWFNRNAELRRRLLAP